MTERRAILITLAVVALLIAGIALAALRAVNTQRSVRPALGPTWHNLTFGQSTKDDVVRVLGQPTEISRSPVFDRQTYYYENSEFDLETYEIKLENGWIKEIAASFSSHSGIEQHIKDFVAKYHEPDYVSWSRFNPDERIIIFEDDGVMIRVWVPTDASVTYEYYFEPCPLECIQAKFPNLMTDQEPSRDVDFEFGPRDPWGYTTDDD
jgi:hypothetical protein